MRLPSVLVLTMVLTHLVPVGLPAADWPAYRGAQGDGRSTETGLLASWPTDGPAVLWRFELGNGYSGISVAGDGAYTLFGSDGDELVLCLDVASGREIWRYRLDDDRRDSQGSGPRSTPTVDGDLLFALGASGMLAALDRHEGTRLWSVDLVEAFGATVPTWGVSTSPVVAGDRLLLDVGGDPGYSLMALDKRTGEVIWHAENGGAGYSTPLVATLGGEPQVLFFTASGLIAVSLDEGRRLWSKPWKTSYDVNAAMPVLFPPDKVLISSSYGTGAAMLQVRRGPDGFEVRDLWRSRSLKNHFNSSVLVGGFLYGFDDGTLRCLEAATGEERWAKRGFAKGSLLYADGKLIILGERGQLALVEATPEDYRELARAQVLRGKTWTMPTLAGGRLFVRSEGELLALSLRG